MITLLRGGSIYNGNMPINRKVLYVYALQLDSKTDLLLVYTTVKSHLTSSFLTLTSRFQDRVLNYCDMFFKLEYSGFSCGEYLYIDD